jgi:hypothetical protein
VNPAPLDDAQRALERRALGNVARLARKLGYQDALNARSEKIVVAAMAILLVAAIAAMALKVLSQASRDEAQLGWRRCMVAYRAAHTDEVRASVRASKPGLGGLELASSVEDRLGDLVNRACGELPR